MLKRILSTMLLGSTLLAQEGNNKKAQPSFDEDDKVMLQAAIILNQASNTACNNLDETKKFNSYFTSFRTRIETKYKGYTLDGANLVEKK